MADDIKRGAVRIITDLHDIRATHPRPGANTVLRGEHQRDVDALVNADLSLARMLDEFDGKLIDVTNGLLKWANELADERDRMEARITWLESRTLRGRWWSLQAWWARTSQRLEQWFLDVVLAIDASTDPSPRREDQ